MTGQPPLTGVKVLEFAGLAPGPFTGMLLADAGASVLRIDRAGSNIPTAPTDDLLTRHKSSIALDLKSPEAVSLVKELSRKADIIIDPFRPGVLERLGLGPDVLRPLNKRLVFGRITGFRRDGRYKNMAGHDINYLAVSGVLSLLGRSGGKPTAPCNILGDFAGGGATLFQAILLALVARGVSGVGQVVEVNMVDGVSYLATFPRLALKTALGDNPRGENLLDTGCPFYDTYETRDGKFMAVGPLEPRFFAVFVKGMGLGRQGWERKQYETDSWARLRHVLETTFKTKSRAEWEMVFDNTDACCTPVLEYGELESNSNREGDQRPSVTLRETPCLAVKKGSQHVSQGHGPGVSGEGYVGETLAPGVGGEEILRQWLGWEKGHDFDVGPAGCFRIKEKSKL